MPENSKLYQLLTIIFYLNWTSITLFETRNFVEKMYDTFDQRWDFPESQMSMSLTPMSLARKTIVLIGNLWRKIHKIPIFYRFKIKEVSVLLKISTSQNC